MSQKKKKRPQFNSSKNKKNVENREQRIKIKNRGINNKQQFLLINYKNFLLIEIEKTKKEIIKLIANFYY